MNRKAALIYQSASLGSLVRNPILTCRERKARQAKLSMKYRSSEGKGRSARSCLVWVQVTWPPEPEPFTFPCAKRKEGEVRKSPVLTAQGGLFQAHTHAALSSVRLDAFGGNMTQLERLA